MSVAGASLRCFAVKGTAKRRIGVHGAVCGRAGEKRLDGRDVPGSQAPSRRSFLPLDLCRVETACSVGHKSSERAVGVCALWCGANVSSGIPLSAGCSVKMAKMIPYCSRKK